MFACFQQLIQVPCVAIQILQLEIGGERTVLQLSKCAAWNTEEEDSEQECTHRVFVLISLITYTSFSGKWLGGVLRKLV